MQLHLFHCCNYLILSTLTLLYLPQKFLFFQPHFALFLLLIFIISCRYQGRFSKWIQHGTMLGLCLLFVHSHAINLINQAEFIVQQPKKKEVEFSIVEILNQRDYSTVVIEAQLQPNFSPHRIFINWKAEQLPHLGERWRGEIQLQPLFSRLNQGGFDRQQWYFARKITAKGTIKKAAKLQDVKGWRERKLQQIYHQTLGLSQQGVILALGFGERGWLAQDVWKLFQQTNTAHLIAISGLHIGLVFSLVFFIVRGLQFILPTPWISAPIPLLCSLIGAGIYSELAGFSIPTLRAIVALCLVIVIHLNRYYYSVWQYLRLTLGILCLLDPIMVLSSSFWLSVGAVFCLILWYQMCPLSLLVWKNRPISQFSFWQGRYIWALLHLQIGLFWLFTPIQLVTFGGISQYSLFSNLLIVPLYSLLIVPCLLFAVFTDGIAQSWQITNQLIEWSIDYLTWFQNGWITLAEKDIYFATALLAFLAGIYFSFLLFKHRSSAQSAVSFIAVLPNQSSLLRLNLERVLTMKSLRLGILISLTIILYCLLSVGYLWFSLPLWRVETLDVGQGLATLIIKNDRAMLYDTGASWKGGSMLELEVIPYLQRQGIKLEKVIISHDDNDHAGGVTAVLQAFPEVQLITSSYKIYPNIQQESCLASKQLQWQGLTLKVLSPQKLVEKAENKDSCVLLITDKKYRLLLTGDANMDVEQYIARHIGKIDVLQVGHHGSKTSTSELLLNMTQPRIAVISSSRNNPWKLPHFSVIERLQRHKIQAYNTALNGQIGISFYPNKLKVTTARTSFSPWYRQIIGEVSKKE